MSGWIWLMCGVILLIIEGATLALVSVWFAIPAFVMALIPSFSPDVEIVVYMVMVVVLFLATRPICKRLLKKNKLDERLIGQIVRIERVVDENYKIYELKLDGKYWKGRSLETLQVGDEVEVKKIEGVTLILEKKGNLGGKDE